MFFIDAKIDAAFRNNWYKDEVQCEMRLELKSCF